MSKGLKAEDLKDLKALFNKSKELADPVEGYQNLEDGDYICQVNKVEIGLTNESNKLIAKWDLIVAEGEPGEGRHIFINQLLDDDKKMKRFTFNVDKFGHDTSEMELEELLEVLVELKDEYCGVNLSTDSKGRQWQKIFVENDEDEEDGE